MLQLYSRRQRVGKLISTYFVELWKIAEHSDFKDTLDEMLRDRLVCRIADARVQHRLLAEHKLTFRKTLDIAQAMELASKDAQGLQSIKDPFQPLATYRGVPGTKVSGNQIGSGRWHT